MGGLCLFEPQFIWKQIGNLWTHIAQLRTSIQLFSPTNNVCLVVIFNNQTRYPKGAVQQMEVEIAALYNTMHINLLWTDGSRVWSWGYGFKYGYWLICTVFCYCLQFQDIHLFWFLLPYVLPFSFQSYSLLIQTWEVWKWTETMLHPISQQTTSQKSVTFFLNSISFYEGS